ncbi:histamine H2 receptor-like [Tubulanus polymorphus]|uniref:histamine H2 receptor-like n=1 Tax=Tubulanus polymorphus TaxID=672921 RepID=UPI003DA64D57
MSSSANITSCVIGRANSQKYIHESSTISASVVVQCVVIFFLILCALCGNSLIFASIYRTKRLQTVTNIYTANLAVTDISVGIFSLPLLVVSVVYDEWILPVELCLVSACVGEILLLVSISTLAGISFDRYLCICHPLTYPNHATPTRAGAFIAVVWLIGLFFGCSPFLGWGRYCFRPLTIPMCSPMWNEDISYAAVVIVVNLTVPSMVMLFSYVRIVGVARKQARQIAQIHGAFVVRRTGRIPGQPTSTSTDVSKSNCCFNCCVNRIGGPRWNSKQSRVVSMAPRSNMKTIKTVFIVVGTFFICWGPYVGLYFYHVNNDEQKVGYVIEMLVTLLAFSNSSVNPYIFALLNKDFRRAWKCLVFDILRKSHRDDTRGGV